MSESTHDDDERGDDYIALTSLADDLDPDEFRELLRRAHSAVMHRNEVEDLLRLIRLEPNRGEVQL
jgi:hypothetical protein